MLARECLSEFRADCELRRMSKRTIKGYYNNNARCLTYLEEKYGITELEEIKTPHLKGYFQYLVGQGLSSTYGNGILKGVRAFFKYAEGEGYISINPALRVRWQKEGKVLINTFTDQEVVALIGAFHCKNYLSARNKLILAIAFDTGARNAEICDMKCQDIRGNVILIHGKGNKERNVPLTPYLRKLMLKYDRLRQEYFLDKNVQYENYLLSRTGKPLTTEALEHIFRKANEKAKVRESVRCSPHTARHYYAQSNLRNGLDVYSLSRLLGHENINITKRYLQSLQDESIVSMAVGSSPLSNLRL
ncbi:MAG: tyrosine-type recombinase/integrase [Ruminiclostridium sp.]|nr:tyrosine-type recombinase/integrase [Ruminiclostridium sp.]